ncbi:MAG: electron transfer flavoprotein subunit beta/FixA family protein [Firmicutes bacterium]|nr:electron transfer flavoprotein subunit beta/FixA family protein [Bacillota bacterium]
MNIVVCIKQVPDTTEVKINPQTNTLMREGVPSIINPFDMYAIEEGLRLRERFGGRVTLLTMGPPQAKDALREALGLGADAAVLLSDRAFAGADTLATSTTLAKGVEKVGNVDLVICGKQAADGDTAQVGPGTAERLGWPHTSFVRKIHEVAGGSIKLERMTETGYEVVEMRLPAVITVVKEINEPRLPSLKGQIRAKSAEIPAWTAADLGATPEQLGLSGSPTQVVRIFTPERRSGGKILEGSLAEQLDFLVARLRETKAV